jgi:tRNA-dihydrouridine synthase
MSAVPARWDAVARAVEIRDALGSSTLIIGNGDIADVADARAKIATSGADGAMLGRAIYGNPWLFSYSPARAMSACASHACPRDACLCDARRQARRRADRRAGGRELENSVTPTPRERLQALSEHLALFDELLGGTTNYATMKKHFKAYVGGWNGAKELRVRLMDTERVEEAQAIISSAILST